MDENEIRHANGRERNPNRITPLRTEQDETDERVWVEMEMLRQQQRPGRPMPRREDLPRPISRRGPIDFSKYTTGKYAYLTEPGPKDQSAGRQPGTPVRYYA